MVATVGLEKRWESTVVATPLSIVVTADTCSRGRQSAGSSFAMGEPCGSKSGASQARLRTAVKMGKAPTGSLGRRSGPTEARTPPASG